MQTLLNKTPFLLFFVLLVFGIYFFPYPDIDSCYIRIHDNLDSYFVYFSLISKMDFISGLNPMHPVTQVMNGLPRFCFPSAFNFTNLFFYFAGPKTGYILNFAAIHLIGFLGMNALLQNYFLTGKDALYIRVFLSLSFGLLPVFPMWGLCLLGQPFLLLAFLKVREHSNRMLHWLIIVLFPFYSYLVFSGIFILIFLVSWCFLDFILTKKINFRFISGIVLFGIVSVMVDYQLVYGTIFDSSFISHRSETFHPTLNFKGVIGVSFLTLLNGHYHSAKYFGLLCFGLSMACLIYGYFQKWNMRILAILLILSGIVSFIFAILDWVQMSAIFEWMPSLNKFSFKRFHFLLPTLTFLSLSSALMHLAKLKNSVIILFPVLVLLLLWDFKMNFQFERNSFDMDYFNASSNKIQPVNFSEYFDEDFYTKLIQEIQEPQNEYRVISLGISPGVLQYNGFYTLDSYQNNYSKKYQNSFCQMNEKEYLKAGKTCSFGNRCYLFSSDIFQGKEKIEKLELDNYMLKKMNCHYLISHYEIINTSVSNLLLIKYMRSGLSGFQIFLYRIV